MTLVSVPVPNAFVAVCVTVYDPTVLNVALGFSKVVFVAPPLKSQVHEVGALVDKLVKFTVPPTGITV